MIPLATFFGLRRERAPAYPRREAAAPPRLAAADFQVAVEEKDLKLVAHLCSAAEKAGDPEFREATLCDIRRIVAKYL